MEKLQAQEAGGWLAALWCPWRGRGPGDPSSASRGASVSPHGPLCRQ